MSADTSRATALIPSLLSYPKRSIRRRIVGLGASNGVIAGQENAWRPKVGIDNGTLRTVQSEVVLLIRDPITLQSSGLYADGTSSTAVEVLLSNWTIGGFPSWGAAGAAELSWTAQTASGDKPFASDSRTLAPGSVPQGQTHTVANLSLAIPVAELDAGAASVVTLELKIIAGDALVATNSWRVPAFARPPPPRACEVTVFAEARFLDSAKMVCSNAVGLPAELPSQPFVVLTNSLSGEVADATRRVGGTALLLNPQQQGQFPVCAASVIGTVPPPFEHNAGQAWWFVAGQVGTVVYNTTFTKVLADASDQMFMHMGFTSVVAKAQGFVLDGLQNRGVLVHIRSIPVDIVADSSETLIHDNALIWESEIPAAGSGDDDWDNVDEPGVTAPGRFIVSGLNLMEEGQPGRLRVGEPQAEFVFRSLVKYAVQLASSQRPTVTVTIPAAGTAPRPQQSTVGTGARPPLCSRVSSICTTGFGAPCEAVAAATAPTICNKLQAVITPTTRYYAASDVGTNASLAAIHVFVEPNDVRNKDAELIGVLYSSPSLDGPKQLVASGTAVKPFMNWTFNGLQPVGKPAWVRLPMPALSLPAAATGIKNNSTVLWLGVLASKDMTCFGAAKGATSPTLGPLAPDSFAGPAPFDKGAPTSAAVWTAGGSSFSAFVSVVAAGAGWV